MKLKELLNHVWMDNNIIIEGMTNREKIEIAKIDGKNDMGIVEGWKFDDLNIELGNREVLSFGCKNNNIEIIISLN